MTATRVQRGSRMAEPIVSTPPQDWDVPHHLSAQIPPKGRPTRERRIRDRLSRTTGTIVTSGGWTVASECSLVLSCRRLLSLFLFGTRRLSLACPPAIRQCTRPSPDKRQGFIDQIPLARRLKDILPISSWFPVPRDDD